MAPVSSASRPGRFIPSNLWIGGWVDPRTGVDYVKKRKFLTLLGLELRPLRRPARSQSLYRLSYPGSLTNVNKGKISLVHSVQKEHGRKERDINDRYMKTRTGGKKSCLSLSGSCPRLWRQQKGHGLHVEETTVHTTSILCSLSLGPDNC
jgi:hypothetical protein